MKQNDQACNRRHFIKQLGMGSLLLCSNSLSGSASPSPEGSDKPSKDQPNILFILADDQCFSALHAAGNDEIITPNLDRLARRGVMFTHAYNQGAWHGAVCVASRAMLNTGQFLWHACEAEKQYKKDKWPHTFWSQQMQEAGYETYFSGKWHVKYAPEKIFDTVGHVRPGMPNQHELGYNRPRKDDNNPWTPWDKQYGGYWQGGKHWSEVLGDDGVSFLSDASKADKPFFMYLAFNAPHDPRQSPKAYVDKYPLEKIHVPVNFMPTYPYMDDIGCGDNLRDARLAPFPRTEYAVKVNRQEYYAIVTHMDTQVGRILDKLEALGLEDNTYIIFTADHGLAVGKHGLIGKQNMFDHSVRVPLMIAGPKLPRDERIDNPVYLQDIMPTCLEIAGRRRPKHVQFHSLLPLMEGGKTEGRHDYIYGGYVDLQRMVTDGRYKLILYPRIKKVLLFDLINDPHEMQDISAEPRRGQIVKNLFQELLRLQKETGDPLDLKTLYPQLL